ncbi:MAG: hypothetical protein FJX45_04495 [Alphaproteobacteria bacterium]|nr:hypothetical protein [Alphaproteobacteria bacterium]MBM3652358.1 hypothetical protein [Alphaproteobacteria bacterium]
MAGDSEKRKGAQKGADFGPKPKGASNRQAALAAALRANLARRKARERALRESAQESAQELAQVRDERSETDSEG